MKFMTIEEITKTQCTGCCACMNICNKNAITMVADDEGFVFPKINAGKCIICGKCYAICPGKDDNVHVESKKGYLIRLKDNILLLNSASGGAFVGIAKYMIEEYDALVVGAAVSEDLSVKHFIVDSIGELVKLQNSKYVQSYIGNVYKRVLDFLDDGRMVLFSGTPCQIAGIYAVVPMNKRERLYTIDLVCHGVPSPALLKRQLEMDSKTKQGRVIDYRFRYKNPNGKSVSSYMMMMMRGLPRIRRTKQDVYFNLFMQGLDFRESCYKCKYANLKRISDFTIGDCDSKEHYLDFYPDESNSIILVNTEKAQNLWENFQDNFDFIKLDVEREAQYNHQLAHPFKRTKQRDNIYQELLNNEWSMIQDKYTVFQSKFDRYKLLVLLNTPERIKKFLTKITQKKM